MKLEEAIKEDSHIEDFEKLVATPFKLSPQGIYIVAKATQNQGKLTHYHNHSAIGTTFFSYVAHQLNKNKLIYEARLVRESIPHYQRFELTNQENRKDTRECFAAELDKIKDSPNLQKVNSAMGVEFWHFLWIADTASEALQERDDKLTVLHYVNGGLTCIDILYNNIVGFRLTSDKNKWRRKIEKKYNSN